MEARRKVSSTKKERFEASQQQAEQSDIPAWKDFAKSFCSDAPLVGRSVRHKGQTGMNREMNALTQGLDAKLAFPQGFPIGRTIATARHRPSRWRDGFPKGSPCHWCRSLASLYSLRA